MLPPRAAWVVVLVTIVSRSILTTGLALLLWGLLPNAVGFQTTTVMSGSMSPRLEVGDAVVVRKVDASQLSPGQVLLFDDPDEPGRLRMHRLVDARPDGRLVTKGDANPAIDSAMTTIDAVHGAGFLRVPFAGLPDYWIRTGQAVPLIATGAVTILLLAGVRLGRLLEDPEERSRRRHRGVRLPAMHRAAAAGAVLAVVSTGALAAPSSAQAVYSATAAPAASAWSSPCGDLAPPSVGAAPTLYWGYGSGAGTVDLGSGGNTAAFSAITRRSCENGFSPSISLNGTSSIAVATKPSDYTTGTTVATWFRVQPGDAGGVLADFSSTSGIVPSARYDKVLYMQDNGSLTFAAATTQATALVVGGYRYCTFPGAFADGQWHLVVAGVGASGCGISVDNATMISQSFGLSVFVLPMTGFWRFGYDVTTLTGAPSRPWFKGDLDETQVYPVAIDPTMVSRMWLGGRGH